MNCPTCPDTMLVMADRSGVEIDYCPKCRGVWLDRGELDKIIERAAAPAPAPAAAPAPQQAYPPQQQYPQQQYPQQQYPQQQYKQKKKSSFLGEIFDF